MTVALECPCGASISIEDASEIASQDLLSKWFEVHGSHRRTREEYLDYLQAVHGRNR